MKWPFVLRSTYDAECNTADFLRHKLNSVDSNSAALQWLFREQRERLERSERENAGIKALLSDAYRRLARFERKRGEAGKFAALTDQKS